MSLWTKMKAMSLLKLCLFVLGYMLYFAKVLQCASVKGLNLGHFLGSGTAVDKAMGFYKVECVPLEQNSLTGILGSAYNPRYMSVNQPLDGLARLGQADPKRKVSFYGDFAVDGDFERELDETPAWETDHFDVYVPTSRKKRTPSVLNPWECQANVRWIDLGLDYFPRYLRTVECTTHDCWYGKYACKARSFTVKILRRKRGKCAYSGRREGAAGLPRELRELWVWEERAVNFCCDCATS